MANKYDFCGYVTKNDLLCSDGRTIRHNAFKECDGETVPLVWQHVHRDVNNVLGHIDLENRDDGVYGYGHFNNTPAGQNAKELVMHGDINSMSIYANNLIQNGNNVVHGVIREVSLVLSGANPGATIENITITHGDGVEFDCDDEAIIRSGINFDVMAIDEEDAVSHAEEKKEEAPVAKNDTEETVQDVIDSMNDKQRAVMWGLIAELAEGSGDDDVEHFEYGEDDEMKQNVFDGIGGQNSTGMVLSHDAMKEIFDDAKKFGSLKDSVLAHAVTYGIDNIDYLFPDAKVIGNTPEFLKRNTEWVDDVLSGCHHSPFSRIKTRYADITADDARAKGYIKGRLKKEEFFRVAGRTTGPCTIYKKQKLDRDDILDITEFDVVAWIKGEMRLMLNEEIARAILVGDGRPVTVNGSVNEDKIDEESIRPVWTDHELYTMPVHLAAGASERDIEEQIIRAMDDYEGTGTPTLYTTRAHITDLLLMVDDFGHRYYKNRSELAEALGVKRIVDVDVMKNLSRDIEDEDSGTTTTYDLWGIIVNLADYNIGADKGGQVSMFDDFDIDYNQYKYLIETRISGALTKLKSAIAIEVAQA